MKIQFRKNSELLTERLHLRVPGISDLNFFIKLYGNSEVMKHIPPKGEPATIDEAMERLNRLMHHWAEHDYGMFVIELKDTNTPAGYCGLRFLHEVGKIELGYIIDQPYWGSGIASEAAAACIQYAKVTLNTNCLISITSPNNHASQKILLKLGFKRSCEDDGVYHGMRHHFLLKFFLYRISIITMPFPNKANTADTKKTRG